MSRMPNLKRALGAFVALAAAAPVAAYAGDRVGALECHVSGNGVSLLVENPGVRLHLQRRR